MHKGPDLPVLQPRTPQCWYLNLPGGVCRLKTEARGMGSLSTPGSPDQQAWVKRWTGPEIPSQARADGTTGPDGYPRYRCGAMTNTGQQSTCTGYIPRKKRTP